MESRKRKRECEQRVFLVPDMLASHGGQIVPLRHPKTGAQAQYVLSADSTRVFEIQRFQDSHARSWFVDDTVESDGHLHFVSEIDPLFLMLPCLLKHHDASHTFAPLDQILEDADYPAIRHLETISSLAGSVALVCETRGGGTMRAFRLDKSKAMQWLHAKVQQVEQQLTESGVNMSQAALSDGFKASTHVSADDRLRYAVGVVCEQLPGELATELRTYLDVAATPTLLAPAAAAAAAAESAGVASGRAEGRSDGPTEDYSKHRKPMPAVKKETPAQKQLKQAAKGSKSISAFFGGGAAKK